MNFLDLIKSTGYITVSKELAREIGLHESMILSELISQYEYFKNRGELNHEGYFYCTIDKMEKQTTLTRELQDKAIKNLIKLNLIKKEIKGLPAKRHFKINEQEIFKLFLTKKTEEPRHVQNESMTQTSKSEKHKQERVIDTNINNNNYNKTEEEESVEIPQKIQLKFQQIFNRQLSVEFYQEITAIYSNTDTILKALSICEQQADKPCYLLVILKDWKQNKLHTITEIDTYLKNRQANKAISHSKRETTATIESPEEELQRLYEEGYR